MDELYWREASRIVSHDSNGPVDAMQRMVQEEISDALIGKDKNARVRTLNRLDETSARIDHQRDAIHTFFLERKALLTEEFDTARKLGRRPPDVVPHPDHVEILASEIRISGPMDRRGRAAWEQLKTTIRVTACLHDIIRAEYRRSPSASGLQELKDIERHRRWLMRRVPKGWNWQEEIYSRDSSLDFAKQLVRELKEIGYVSPDALD